MGASVNLEREPTQGITMIYPVELVERIDAWRFDNRFPARSDAIRWLVEYALRTHPELTPEELAERRSMVTKLR